MQFGRSITAAFAFLSVPCAIASAQVTQRVSVSTNSTQANFSSYYTRVSNDGRFVAFESMASNLVPNDTNNANDVFVRDRVLGTTERVTVSSTGAQANASGALFARSYLSISSDGRFVAFSNDAPNLAPNDTAGNLDVFLRDRQLGTTELISVNRTGTQGNGTSHDSWISDDGRYVAFSSYASNLVLGDTNGSCDVFVRDRQLGTTERISVNTIGVQGNSNSQYASMSPDGRYIAYNSYSTNLVTADTNGMPDVFLRDRQAGTTIRVSVTSGGGFEVNGASTSPSISANGRYVAFESQADNLVPGNDLNGASDAFVADILLGTVERVSVSNGGFEANAGIFNFQYPSPMISADGRYVTFWSASTNLTEDTNNAIDVFVHDRRNHSTERVSVNSHGLEGDVASMWPSISANGRFVAFASAANNFLIQDTNQDFDIYVHDRLDGTAITNVCVPGTNGTLPCPCNNPPSAPGHGCENSASTGGAVLSASGGAFLSSDDLVFTMTGGKPASACVLMEFPAAYTPGMVYGQGVHCTSGSSLVLYKQTSSGGSIKVPDYGRFDMPVTEISAFRGYPISPGQSWCYVVDYRDGTVLGGCPSRNTVNTTQTVQVTWAP
jgi:Tol biopolymer transport system component